MTSTEQPIAAEVAAEPNLEPAPVKPASDDAIKSDAYPVDVEKSSAAKPDAAADEKADDGKAWGKEAVAILDQNGDDDANKEQEAAATKLQSMKRSKDARAQVQQKRVARASHDSEAEPSGGEPDKADDDARASAASGKSNDGEEEEDVVYDMIRAADKDGAPGGGRRNSLMDMMSLLSSAGDATNQAKLAAEEAKKKAAEAEKKTERQRRASRELEQQVFGMHLTDVHKLKQKFDEIDSDGSGSIDREELAMALKKVGKDPSKRIVEILMEKVDTDGNGTVEFDEFQVMIKDWDHIIAEAEEKERRENAAKEAAKPTKFRMSNEMSDEAKERRRSMEIDMGLLDMSTPSRGLSKTASKEIFDPQGGGSRSRSRRQSKELAEFPARRRSISGELPEDAGSPDVAGGGLQAVRGLSSTGGDAAKVTKRRQSKELDAVDQRFGPEKFDAASILGGAGENAQPAAA